MKSQTLLGHARFGKRDGFEILAREGVLQDFRSPEAQTHLEKVLALRQEEIRLPFGSEILGLSCMNYRGRTYRLLTLYRYALDRYKRDGYRAVTLVLRDSWAEPQLLLEELRHLEELDLHHPNPDHAFSSSWEPYAVATPENLPGLAEVFIPLAEGTPMELSALIAAWGGELCAEYQTLYASASPQVLHSIDSGRIAVWERNPYWKHVTLPQPVTAHGPVPQPMDYPDEDVVPLDSLVHAYQVGSEDQWERKETKSSAPPRQKPSRTLLYWGIGAILMAGLTGLWWWLM